ncbi:peroxide stress protein YaaA [Microbacterium binotii]|uniref:Peroxide stress protein YaaA n=1 Tax=Microbacterium binotii TaxID=462710 RepID=A0ABN3P6M6_9MICO
MLVLLPPSETKRAGGAGAPWSSAVLRLPQLAPQREAVVSALVELSRDEDAAAKVLKLSTRQRGEVAVNAALRSSPTMPAVDRYTGVLFDALDASSLDAPARRWLGEHVLIHSAPFGPVGALDPLPAYRLGAGTSLPGIAPLRRHWARAVTLALGEVGARFILDMRSEAYVALGPVPTESASAYVRVVTTGEDGEVRALNHFNKHAKGALVRRLAQDRPRIASRAAFLCWAEGAGIALVEAGDGEIRLTV